MKSIFNKVKEFIFGSDEKIAGQSLSAPTKVLSEPISEERVLPPVSTPETLSLNRPEDCPLCRKGACRWAHNENGKHLCFYFAQPDCVDGKNIRCLFDEHLKRASMARRQYIKSEIASKKPKRMESRPARLSEEEMLRKAAEFNEMRELLEGSKGNQFA